MIDQDAADQGALGRTGNLNQRTNVYDKAGTDFTPGEDRIDLSAIAASLRASNPGVDLLANGFILLTDSSAGVQIRIDTDGATGSAAARPLVTLRGVTVSTARSDLRIDNGSLVSLVVGQAVEVKGGLAADGRTLEATRIKIVR